MRMEEGSPEKAEMEKKEEALKSRVAVRCAKAALLLSSLKPLPNSTADHHHQEKKMLEVKMELARERLKNKRIKQCALIELVLELALVLSLSTFFFMLFLSLIEL
ncbi:uncharacterized protein LOC126709081 [Quercus robur]|uniref:uncharacterized protein LOC126709081 n=1 Tax=Quercus robur TaxID=38942 RepID=UPI002163451A|nr:uncharacterized protein LOC126709081 [Quercus robur]